MNTAAAGLSARHSQLLRVAQCAGEAFAYDEPRPARAGQPRAVWLGIAVVAALALFVAF